MAYWDTLHYEYLKFIFNDEACRPGISTCFDIYGGERKTVLILGQLNNSYNENFETQSDNLIMLVIDVLYPACNPIITLYVIGYSKFVNYNNRT